MAKLIMVRHGESDGNRERRFTSTPAAPLTDLGRAQAREAAETIKKGRFAPRRIITSPYSRAHETGRIIASVLELPVEIEEGIYEREFGYLRGMSYDAIHQDPSYNSADLWTWKPEGGESFEDLRRRIAPIIDKLAARSDAEGELMVVSHGGVMLAAWAHVTGSWEGAQVPPNCGIILIERAAGDYKAPTVVAGAPTVAPF